MTTELAKTELRPLGVGEIFDRAVTLYFRNAATFTIIGALGALPSILPDFLSGTNPRVAGVTVFFAAVLGWACATLATVATAAAVQQVYLGEPRSWASAYKKAISHAGAILTTSFLRGLLAGGVALLGILLLMMVSGGGPFALVLFSPIVIGLGMVAFALYYTVLLACIAVALEDADFGEAWNAALRRVFAEHERRHTVFFLLAVLAVAVVQAGTHAVTTWLVPHLGNIGPIAGLIGYALAFAVTALSALVRDVPIAVFYFDTRVRQEAFGLQATLESLTPQQQPQ